MRHDTTCRAHPEGLRERRAPRRIVVPVTLAADSIELVGGYAAELPYDQHLVDLLVRERLEEIEGGLAGGSCVRTVVTWGPVGPALVATAREQQADLAVIPMRRESEWRHLAHDHTDRHVLHHIDVPVLVVPTHAPPAPLA